MNDMTVPPWPSSGVELAPGVFAHPPELRFHFARAGGPGGQNVNKVNTKAELRVRPEALRGLSGRALSRLRTLFANRLTSEGDLLITAETGRSQLANRRECLKRLREILVPAQQEPKIRKRSRPTRASNQRRLDAKKARSRIKQQRRFTAE